MTSQGICMYKILNTKVLFQVCLSCLCLLENALMHCWRKTDIAVTNPLVWWCKVEQPCLVTELSDLWVKLLNIHTSAGTCHER